MEQSNLDKQQIQQKKRNNASFIQKKGANTFMGKTQNSSFLSSSPISQHKEDTNSNRSFTFGNIPIIQNKVNTIQTVMGGGTGGKEMEEEAQMKVNPLQRQEAEEEMQMKENPLQRQEEEEEMQMKENPLQKKSTNSNGLPAEVQAKMESGLGADFSNVNIHKDSKSATDVGALAYAQGNDVHFAPGQFKPNTQAGQELIGHELTHVVQQREGRVKPTTQAKGMPVNDDKGLEKEADDMGKMAAQGKFEDNGKALQKKTVNNNTQTIQKDDPPAGGIREVQPDIPAVTYSEGLRTFQGEIKVWDSDLIFDDQWCTVNYTVRLGKASWTDSDGTQQDVWVVDQAAVLVLSSASEFKVAPKIDVRPRIVAGKLKTFIGLSLQLAGPKVTESVTVTGTAGISSSTGVQIGEEVARANASTSRSLSLGFSCGRTVELPGAEIGMRRGVELRNYGGGSASLHRDFDFDVGPPSSVDVAGTGGVFEGDNDIRSSFSGALHNFNVLN
ncbi:MAG: DUF4157 domain-containing protein [Chitinophagales bacterium]